MVFFKVKNRENGLGIPVRYRVLIKKSKTTNVLKEVFGRKNIDVQNIGIISER